MVGDRVALYNDGGTPVFTEPEPFTTMELRYERAYGGVDIYSDPKVQCVYGRNHLGRGFAVANVQRAVDNLPLPNLEDPADRLTPERLTIGHFIHWEQQPMPQGFGWFSKYWRPRALMAGVMPADRETERELRAAHTQLVPADMRADVRSDRAAAHGFPLLQRRLAGAGGALSIGRRAGAHAEPGSGRPSQLRSARRARRGSLSTSVRGRRNRRPCYRPS